ncbi:TPA: hypothetical protein ACN35J_000583 [Vibrio parahaemolyticus]
MSLKATSDTGWVKPINQITGLDHLGVQAPCIEVYGKLLPGITNVTDRARYYSFYAWVFYAFERKKWLDSDTFLKMFRRADCLFTLAAMAHETGDNSTVNHSGALVGKDTFQKHFEEITSGKKFKLSQFSHTNPDSSRYFKNSFGGLGQYYFGTLCNLKILAGESPKNGKLIEEVGLKLAKAFDQNVNSSLFLETIENDEFTYETLTHLKSFCPCNLSCDSEERTLLISLFTKGFASLYQTEYETDFQALNRVESMAYILALTEHITKTDTSQSFDVAVFRKLAYTNALQYSGKYEHLWNIESSWQDYARNEIASIAMQGIFYCVLKATESRRPNFKDTRSIALWYWQEGPGSKVTSNYHHQQFDQTLSQLSVQLPNYERWDENNHEVTLAHRVEKLTKNGSNDLESITKNCLMILAALVSRTQNKSGYNSVELQKSFLDRYPLNLLAICETLNTQLNKQSTLSALIQLTHHGLLENHFLVAMRKLRNQQQMTFRFLPSEFGIEIIKPPPAVFTSPRFKQVIQIMADLGMVRITENSFLVEPAGYDILKVSS